jgi:hypothetical protein
MRRIAQVGLGVAGVAVALWLVPVVYLVYVFGWPLPDCGPESAAVAKARSLSQARLAGLHAEMSRLAGQDPSAHSIPAELWPPAVASLHPRKVSADFAPRIMLEGCFDHFVFLQFEGTPGELTPRTPKVLVSWGEGPNSGVETLWQP